MNLGDPLVSVKKMRVGLRVKKKVGEVELVHVFFVDALDFERVFVLKFQTNLSSIEKK